MLNIPSLSFTIVIPSILTDISVPFSEGTITILLSSDLTRFWFIAFSVAALNSSTEPLKTLKLFSIFTVELLKTVTLVIVSFKRFIIFSSVVVALFISFSILNLIVSSSVKVPALNSVIVLLISDIFSLTLPLKASIFSFTLVNSFIVFELN